MTKILSKNSILTLALLAGILLSNQPLHAQWTAHNYAEIATAGLRGVCSRVEHDLQKNNTTSAHVKRTLISALRVAHSLLIIKNHPNDYYNNYFNNQYFASAYLDGCLPSDAIEGIGNLFALIERIIDGGGKDLSGQSFESGPLKFMQRIMLPAIESSAALFLAISNDSNPNNQPKRFIARKILTLSSLCHDFLGQEKGSSKYTMGVMILVHLVHAGYQLKHDDSSFNTWLNKQIAANPLAKPQQEQKPEDAEPQQRERQQAQPPRQPMTEEQRALQRQQILEALERRQQEHQAPK